MAVSLTSLAGRSEKELSSAPTTPRRTSSKPTLSTSLQHAAHTRLEQCLNHANRMLKRNFAKPELLFSVRGKAAGKAYLQSQQIRLNPTLFAENPQAFLDEVIPHELAHLLVYQLYGRVKPHGREWQTIMKNVFGLPARTTHDFAVASVQGKTFEYRCQCQTLPLSVRRHNKVQRGEASYHCRRCRAQLHHTGIQLS
ncbi:SprT family zinc-dependent metalloprotease [Vibrio sp. SM6]|uniref:Protein SprT n=1 Tax=Vibrio agarilyticus TaxID=2726741 RepID=A0A7X8TQA6_9VIBR|nr:SprT family zinc-dependent metalloprotease [Vibrio agarilyticus]NLS12873.1 SprT family zinc-dependent metalloprotease [Vibrio agarilyticus]